MDNEEQPNLINLPGVLVSRVASYLPKPVKSFLPRTSNVCFAMGLAHSRVSSRQWKRLDIGDIQHMCDSNLTDDDVRRILIAIDGVNKIKSLKLTDCFGITGAGLSPLRGSTVLERIDLGDTRPLLEVDVVVPLLNSILDREDNSLSYVDLPFQWRKDWKDNVMVASFLRRFNDSLLSRIDQHERDDDFFCESCNGRYFKGCIEVGKCGQCEKETCEGCGDYCEKCESIFCSSCGLLGACDYCEKECCSRCSVKCDECDKVYCKTCDNVKQSMKMLVEAQKLLGGAAKLLQKTKVELVVRLEEED